MLLRRDATYVTLAILPIRNVNLTSLPIARIVLILKAELFLRTTTMDMMVLRTLKRLVPRCRLRLSKTARVPIAGRAG